MTTKKNSKLNNFSFKKQLKKTKWNWNSYGKYS